MAAGGCCNPGLIGPGQVMRRQACGCGPVDVGLKGGLDLQGGHRPVGVHVYKAWICTYREGVGQWVWACGCGCWPVGADQWVLACGC